jgi:hypothetical protein
LLFFFSLFDRASVHSLQYTWSCFLLTCGLNVNSNWSHKKKIMWFVFVVCSKYRSNHKNKHSFEIQSSAMFWNFTDNVLWWYFWHRSFRFNLALPNCKKLSPCHVPHNLDVHVFGSQAGTGHKNKARTEKREVSDLNSNVRLVLEASSYPVSCH